MFNVTTLASEISENIPSIKSLIKDAVWAFRVISKQRLIRHLQDVFQNYKTDFKEDIIQNMELLIKEREIMDGGNGKVGMAPIRCFELVPGVYRYYGGSGSTPKFSGQKTNLSPAYVDVATRLSGGRSASLSELISTFKYRETTGDVNNLDQFQVYDSTISEISQFRRWKSAHVQSTGYLWRTKRSERSVYFLTDGKKPSVGTAYKLNSVEKNNLMWALDLDSKNPIEVEIVGNTIQVAGMLPYGLHVYLLSFCSRSFNDDLYRNIYTLETLPENLQDRKQDILASALVHIQKF